MISPINFGNFNFVNFKGNTQATKKNSVPLHLLDKDVFQLTTPKHEEGFMQRTATAITAPFRNMSANANQKRLDKTSNSSVLAMNTLVKDYIDNKDTHNIELAQDLNKFAKDKANLDKAFDAASHIEPDDDSNTKELDSENSHIYYSEDGTPDNIVYNESKDEYGVKSADKVLNFAGGEIFENVTKYPKDYDIVLEADSITSLGANDSSILYNLASKLGGPFIAKGVQIAKDGICYADSISVFYPDENGKISDVTTFKNVEIDDKLEDKRLPFKQRAVFLNAQEAYKSIINGTNVKDEYYYQDYQVSQRLDLDNVLSRNADEEIGYLTEEIAKLSMDILPDGFARTYVNSYLCEDVGFDCEKHALVRM